MNRLKFHDMFTLSETERTARSVQFHPRMTVLTGENDTGKSSLLKSIYWAFGATPRNRHPRWKSANVVTSVGFSVDGGRFRILRERDHFSLFDGDGQFIREFSSVTKGLARYFARIFSFRLQLSMKGRDGDDGQATPAFLFLPFYVDQDRGWVENWSSFENLGQFSNWKTDVADFHVGIRPSEFYVAKSERFDAQTKKKAASDQLEVVLAVQSRLEQSLTVGDFDVDIDDFREEVEELIARGRSLKEQEEKIREQLVRCQNERDSLLQQRSIVEAVLRELGRDFDFTSSLPNEVECPTCGTTHENGFSERFGIAQDEGRAEEFLTEISENLARVDDEIARVSDWISEARIESEKVQALLGQRKGDLELVDIVRDQGKKELRSIMGADVAALRRDVGGFAALIEEKKLRMEQFDDRDRRKDILSFYRDQMRTNLHRLNVVGLTEESFRTPDKRIVESGSDQPRALLAFYFAVLAAINRYSTSTFCPIVIDSPRQQDQDDSNWIAMLEFIRDSQPPGSQLILGMVDDGGVVLPGDSIVMRDKYRAMTQADYSHVYSDLKRLRIARETGAGRR